MTPHRQEPFAVELGRVVAAFTAILARDMNETFQDLTQRGAPHRLHPKHRAATAAHRIVVLCGRLIDALQRYEDTRCWDPQEDDHPGDDFPF